MIAHKTDVLEKCQHMCCFENSREKSKNLSNFSEKIGVTFQTQDDLLNLVGEEYVKKKIWW